MDPSEPDDDGAENYPLGLYLLRGMDVVPEALLQAVRAHHPSFDLRLSKTVGRSYYANACEQCGSLMGDHFLFSEPGGAFWPTIADEFAKVVIHRLAIEGEFRVDAQYSLSGQFYMMQSCKVLDPNGDPDQLVREALEKQRATSAATPALATPRVRRPRKTK